MREGMRHHALTTCLVQQPVSAFDDGDLEPGPRAVQRGGKAGGPAAGDQQVDHVRLASAEFSTLIRVRSSAALSTREDHGGQPRRVHQRQRDALDDDRDVVGVRDHTGRGRR